jgi:hypothetical protein
VGDGIVPGKSKTIEWNIAEELVTYRGQISFRLKGEVTATALSFQLPAANSTIRTGKVAGIEWKGGNKTAQVKLELLQGGRVIRSIHEGSNSGKYAWSVPKDLEKGTYNLRISAASENVVSGPVVVKSPLPLWVKLSPVVVAGVVVVLILTKPTDPTGPQDSVDDDLPNAPRPN